jgi:hypothetical protein
VPLISVNLLLQPICFLFVTNGVHALAHAMCGRLTYACRVIPLESVPPEEFRAHLLHRAASGVIGVLLGCGLSYACLQPLLELI